MAAQPAGEADAVEPGHVLVGQHQVEGASVGLLERVFPIDGLDDFVSRRSQREGHDLAHGLRIIDSKD